MLKPMKCSPRASASVSVRAEAFHKHGIDENEVVIDTPMPDHNAAMALVHGGAARAAPPRPSILWTTSTPMGHRVVQGGKYFDQLRASIDDDVDRQDRRAGGARASAQQGRAHGHRGLPRSRCPASPWWPSSTPRSSRRIPPKAYMYPLPYELYEKHAIRKYGAHGTSHRYIAERAAAALHGRALGLSLKLITCHLGQRLFHLRPSTTAWPLTPPWVSRLSMAL